MNKQVGFIQIVRLLLIALWVYAAISKLANLTQTRSEMLNQVFPIWIAEILYWLIPVTELGVAFLLVYSPVTKIAFRISLALLLLFSLYIVVVMTGIFGRVPCSCGGILKHMSYGTHFLFNMFYVTITFMAIQLQKTFSLFNQKKEVVSSKNKKTIAGQEPPRQNNI